MHIFGKAPLTFGQTKLDQAQGRSGHNISYNQVRAEIVPPCLNKLSRSKLIVNINGKEVVYPCYSNMIKFFKQEPLSVIDNTNGDAWCFCETTLIKDDKGEEIETKTILDNFIAPSDVLFNNQLSEGYAIEVYDKHGKQISSNYYTFDYYSGILVLTPDVTAEQKTEWGNLHATVFRYIGKTVDNYFKDIENTIETTEAALTNLIETAKNTLSGLIEKAN